MTRTQTLADTASRLAPAEPLATRLSAAAERLDAERLEQLWEAPLAGDYTAEESLIRAGLVDEYQIARAHSERYLLPIFDPPAAEAPPVDPRVAQLLPAELCREHRIAPLADDGTTLDVAVFSPDALWLADDLRLLTGRHMRPLFTPLSVLDKLLDLLYAEAAAPRPEASSAAAPTATPPAVAKTVSRSAERSQAGVVSAGLSPIDFARPADTAAAPPSADPSAIHSLGLDARQQTDLLAALESPHGIVLFAGPPRSGKSTTLQACLGHLERPNVCTIDAATASESTVAAALRSWLRQDPDVVAVSEIRNLSTAQICVRAALTGHFVISTFQCEDGLSAAVRLMDLGIDPHSLGETLRGILCQRLVRRLCTACRAPHRVAGRMAQRYGLADGSTAYRAVGCPRCDGSGYQGWLPIFEMIRADELLSDTIRQRKSHEALQRSAVQSGIALLADSVADAVAAGLTSFEEALRVPPRQDRRSG